MLVVVFFVGLYLYFNVLGGRIGIYEGWLWFGLNLLIVL